MKKILLGLLALTAASAFAGDPPADDGDPILPPLALAVHLAPDSVMEEGLALVAEIRWQDPPAGEVVDDAIEVQSYSASLLVEPATRPLPNSSAPRECAEVRRERRQVRARIERVAYLRAVIEARLDRASKSCARSPNGNCRSAYLDGPLNELNNEISKLRDYAEREAASTADRQVWYRFHLDGAAGLASLRQGWRPVGAGVISRVRFPRGPWQPGDSLVLGAEGALDGPPAPLADGSWVVSRTLTATHACATGSVFNLEFHSSWQKDYSLGTVLIKGIAL